MEGQLNGKTALVTGASRGIGRAIAVALAEQGAVVGLMARSRDQLQETQSLIEKQKGRSVVLSADVSIPDQVEEALGKLVKDQSTLDILVNDAGVHTAVGPVGEDDPEAWWYDLTVNLRGPYLLCRAALPFMHPGGTIVNVASGAGMKGFPFSSAYGASKAALIHFTESLAIELESKKISVFAIRPGAVRTSITRILDTPNGQKYLAHIAKLFETGSELLVSAEKPAELVLALCRPEAAVLSGRMISVLDDLPQLIAQVEHIREQQLYQLRLNTL
jgi:NAD(P)-dependent dehydrogenase (short-subunit alcohol dehydrogenase family)